MTQACMLSRLLVGKSRMCDETGAVRPELSYAPNKEVIKALRDFSRHVGEHCVPHKGRGEEYYQHIADIFCDVSLPKHSNVESRNYRKLQRHKHRWDSMTKGPTPFKGFAEWCQLCINNKASKQSWRQWCVCMISCLLDPKNK